MKKINLFLIAGSLFFGLVIVFFSAFRVVQGEVFAEEQNQAPKIVEIAGEGEEMVPELPLKDEQSIEFKEIDYYLPYPGILPDHPFYWLKMTRDKITLFFTRKPIVRYERLLLYADKRIGAAEALIKGGKTELGITTADKAEKYLEEAISQLSILAKEGKATPEMQTIISKAALKHEEVLLSLLEKTPDQSKPKLDQIIEKNRLNYQKVLSQFD